MVSLPYFNISICLALTQAKIKNLEIKINLCYLKGGNDTTGGTMDILNLEKYNQLKNTQWRNGYHIQPPHGLLNDPNGMIYHKGIYHIFYQWHPFETRHGLKYWNHLTSKDLIHFEQGEHILKPSIHYDKDGAYSGSAYTIDDEVMLIYTGNSVNDKIRTPYQIIKPLEKDEKTLVVDGNPKGYTGHYRDPKVWKENDEYLMILGAQKEDLTGCVVIYESKDGLEWNFKHELKTNYDQDSFMWECPDLIKFKEEDILLFCPQSTLKKENSNIYDLGYMIGHYDKETGTFENSTQFEILDHGFEAYASHSFEDEHGNRVLYVWMGAADTSYPDAKDGWTQMLSLPRVLNMKNGTLTQTPHPHLEALRLKEESNIFNKKHNNQYELILDDIKDSFELKLFKNEDEELVLTYDKNNKKLTLDRSKMQHQFAQNYGVIREMRVKESLISLQIFVDQSSIEIFVNHGEAVMSSRIFPKDKQNEIQLNQKDIKITLYPLKTTNI